jgi:hypothetical protein
MRYYEESSLCPFSLREKVGMRGVDKKFDYPLTLPSP